MVWDHEVAGSNPATPTVAPFVAHDAHFLCPALCLLPSLCGSILAMNRVRKAKRDGCASFSLAPRALSGTIGARGGSTEMDAGSSSSSNSAVEHCRRVVAPPA